MHTFFPAARLAAITVALASYAVRSAAAQPADSCFDVVAAGGGPLVNSDGSVGVAPIAVTFGHMRGTLSAIVASYGASASKGDDARHLTLVHTFVSTDPARAGTLTMKERALCAPGGSGPATCRGNDVLTIVAASGIFTNAAGSLRNLGAIDFTAYKLTFSIRGRLCGDGL